MKDKISKAQKKGTEVANAFLNKDMLKTDPLGSYTGKPENPMEKPTQDADDL